LLQYHFCGKLRNGFKVAYVGNVISRKGNLLMKLSRFQHNPLYFYRTATQSIANRVYPCIRP
jgi:hypothetical protein